MANEFTIPEKGSPLDVARDIMSDFDVQNAIQELMSAISLAAQARGLTIAEIEQATDSVLNSVPSIIEGAIESGFEHVLQVWA